jgi:hypothetical protein
MANHPVISPEAWEALKAASIRGVPDSQLAETFGVETNAIRQRRFIDPIWKAAVSAKRELAKERAIEVDKKQELQDSNLTGKLTEASKSPPAASLAAKVASTVSESIASLGESNRLLALQIAAKGLRQAEQAPPDVQSWGDVKALVEIVHKASGMEGGNAVQVNILNSGEFDFVPASMDSMEII